MKFYNQIDDQGRFYGFFVTDEPAGQVDSHGFSYLFARKFHQETGDVMGLDVLDRAKLTDKKSYRSGEQRPPQSERRSMSASTVDDLVDPDNDRTEF